MTRRSVAVLGTGNLAWHFCNLLKTSDLVSLSSVISRSRPSGLAFIRQTHLKAKPKTLGDGISEDYLLLCVRDNAISSILKNLSVAAHTTVIHTSGAEPLDTLLSHTARAGVIYPFQTFTKNKPLEVETFPLFVEAVPEVREEVMFLARRLSPRIREMDSEKSLKLHLAGVLAANFSNFMIWKAGEIMDGIGVERENLRSIVMECTRKAFEIGAENAQTGPAIRGDWDVIERHIDIIPDKHFKEIYRAVSQDIYDKIKDRCRLKRASD